MLNSQKMKHAKTRTKSKKTPRIPHANRPHQTPKETRTSDPSPFSETLWSTWSTYTSDILRYPQELQIPGAELSRQELLRKVQKRPGSSAPSAPAHPSCFSGAVNEVDEVAKNLRFEDTSTKHAEHQTPPRLAWLLGPSWGKTSAPAAALWGAGPQWGEWCREWCKVESDILRQDKNNRTSLIDLVCLANGSNCCLFGAFGWYRRWVYEVHQLYNWSFV